jgi:hypothetical protein
VHDQKPPDTLNEVRKHFIQQLELSRKQVVEMRTDIDTIAYVGYCIATAATCATTYPDITRAFLYSNVAFASKNFKVMKVLLKTTAKQNTFESILNEKGFKHQCTVCHISNDGM